MKSLFIIGGTMGVGKTTVCQLLKKKLNNAVFLDGDWCWDADPFIVNEETKAVVIDNICHTLNNFLHCSAYENVIFCWVLHEQSIIDGILSRLDTDNVAVQAISFICSKEALIERLQNDVDCGKRKPDIIERSVARMPLYSKLNTIKLDTSNISAETASDIIAKADFSASERI